VPRRVATERNVSLLPDARVRARRQRPQRPDPVREMLVHAPQRLRVRPHSRLLAVSRRIRAADELHLADHIQLFVQLAPEQVDLASRRRGRVKGLYDGELYLRFSTDAVYRNERSPDLPQRRTLRQRRAAGSAWAP
jgi:hypothetical protein